MSKQTAPYPKGVKLIKNVYAIFVFAFPFALIFSLLTHRFEYHEYLEIIPHFLIRFAIYYGIKRTKNWIVNLILIYTSWGLISLFYSIWGLSGDAIKLSIYFLGNGFVFAFCVYTIIVFLRQETRNYFRESGVLII